MTYPDSLSTATYDYDKFNRLTQIDYPISSQRYTTYEYDDASRLVKKTLPNGQYTDYDYDAVNRLTALINRKADATVISQYAYTHDTVGNRLQKTETRGQTTDVFDYDYDDIYRLIDVEKGLTPTESYSYDNVGNRDTSIDYTNWVHDNENKLNSYDSTTYTYDNNGSMTVKNISGSLTNYTWDYDNQLIQVTRDQLPVAGYMYDVFGRRISKTVNSTTTYYLYDDQDVIVEYNSDGTIAARYLHGQDVDEPISMTRGGNTYYYTFDGLGSVSELTDSTQAVVESYKYDSFGNTTILDANGLPINASTVGNPYMYTSREYDSETELYFYRARYYDPGIGRFLSQDPIGFEDSMNLYQYCGNNAVNWVDPYGLLAVAMSNPVAVGAKGAVPWYGTPQNNGSEDKSRDFGYFPKADIGDYARDQSGSYGQKETCPDTYNKQDNGDGKKEEERPERPDSDIEDHEPPSKPHTNPDTGKKEPYHWHYWNYDWDGKSWRKGSKQFGGPGQFPRN